jgi:hypothetical protein
MPLRKLSGTLFRFNRIRSLAKRKEREYMSLISGATGSNYTLFAETVYFVSLFRQQKQ